MRCWLANPLQGTTIWSHDEEAYRTTTFSSRDNDYMTSPPQGLAVKQKGIRQSLRRLPKQKHHAYCQNPMKADTTTQQKTVKKAERKATNNAKNNTMRKERILGKTKQAGKTRKQQIPQHSKQRKRHQVAAKNE